MFANVANVFRHPESDPLSDILPEIIYLLRRRLYKVPQRHNCHTRGRWGKLQNQHKGAEATSTFSALRILDGKEDMYTLRSCLEPITLNGRFSPHGRLGDWAALSREPKYLDVVFVSLDFEVVWCPRCPTKVYQVGVSTLDTRDVCDKSLWERVDDIISTRNVCTRTWSAVAKAAKGFMFGATECIPQSEISNSLKTVLLVENPQAPSKKYRRIVLIGHGICSELAVWDKIGLNVDEIASVVAILDTTKIAKHLYEKGPCSLKALLDKMGCPWGRLHNAGNDSNYVLRVILMLVVESMRRKRVRGQCWHYYLRCKRSHRLRCRVSVGGMRMLGLYEVNWGSGFGATL